MGIGGNTVGWCYLLLPDICLSQMVIGVLMTKYPCRECGKYSWINKDGVDLCRVHYYEAIGKPIPETISVKEFKDGTVDNREFAPVVDS